MLETTPPDQDIQINSDSKYVINGVTDWIKKWEADNWSTPIANKRFFQKILTLMRSREGKVEFVHFHLNLEIRSRT